MSVATNFDKIIRKSVGGNVEFTLKFRQFYPPFVTFLPLEGLFMSNLCCQKAFRIIENLQHKFLNMLCYISLLSGL